MKAMSNSQKRVLNAIWTYWSLFSRPPSVRDLATMLGYASPNGVSRHLKSLKDMAEIETVNAGTARGIWPANLKQEISKLASARSPK